MRATRKMMLARSSLVAVAFLVVAGCSSTEEDAPPGPPPSEPLVFEASNETKSELGIVKWGFAADGENGVTSYRGYGARNEVLVTVVQKNDTSDPGKQTFTMTLTGPTASASERIELYLQRAANGEDQLFMNVLENTFEEGTFPRKVLMRFQADGDSSRATVGAGSLVTNAAGDELVARCNESVLKCINPLIDARVAASAEGNACSLVSRIGQPVLLCGAAAFFTLETGPGAALACAGAGYTSSLLLETACADARLQAVRSATKFKACDRNACPASTQ